MLTETHENNIHIKNNEYNNLPYRRSEQTAPYD